MDYIVKLKLELTIITNKISLANFNIVKDIIKNIENISLIN